MLAAPLLFLAMKAIARHYAGSARARARRAAGVALPARIHARGAGLESARADPARARVRRRPPPASLRAVKVADRRRRRPAARPSGSARRADAARGHRVAVPRDRAAGLRYVRRLLREHPGDVIAVVIPEYVVEHWWQHLLHNQTALAAEGAAALRAVGDRDQRAVAAGRRAHGR